MRITFCGGAREVTGSCFLFETEAARFLVDCGMFQGGRGVEARNREAFEFDPRSIDFVLLTHAHIDHCGLLPKLTRSGFRGPIFLTHATADLLAVMLRDSAHIQAKEAAQRLRRGRKAGVASGASVLYTLADVEDCLEQARPTAYDEWLQAGKGVRCRFRDAGHIIGSSIIEMRISDGARKTSVVCTGDLGQPGRPILRDPVTIEDTDVLLIESTYGNRAHRSQQDTLDELAQVVEHTLRVKRGNVIIPAFAVGRTQEILYHLLELVRHGRLHDLKIFVDSPMATAVTAITMKHLALFDSAAHALAGWHAAGEGVPYLNFVAGVDESMALNRIRSGAIIIAASGMCDAGRIRHHLRHNLGRAECSVVFVGFQAQGTLGRRLVDGARRVMLFGEDITVRASVHTLGGYSAHADLPALMAWTGALRRPPDRTFVVHGEEATGLQFADHLRTSQDFDVTVPRRGDTFEV